MTKSCERGSRTPRIDRIGFWQVMFEKGPREPEEAKTQEKNGREQCPHRVRLERKSQKMTTVSRRSVVMMTVTDRTGGEEAKVGQRGDGRGGPKDC